VCFVDRLDGAVVEEAKTIRNNPQLPQQGEMEVPPDLLQVVEGIGGGGGTRTYDVRIMSPETLVASKEDKGLNSADSGKVQQNRQPRRNRRKLP
jgi:hypothetical protein